MSTNSQKTPLGWAQNDFTRGRARDVVDALGKSMPCHVVQIVSSGIVYVAFDVTGAGNLPNTIMPVAESEYVRLPLQIGAKGVAVSSDYYLGGSSGLGGGTASATQQANLSTLVFVPIGNVNWSLVDTSTLALIGGPNGVLIESANGDHKITVPNTGNITIVVPSGAEVIITDGGSTQPVRLADGSASTVLMSR